MRVWIGIQKMLAHARRLDRFAFISAMSLSQVMPGRHSLGWLERDDQSQTSKVARDRSPCLSLAGFAKDTWLNFRKLASACDPGSAESWSPPSIDMPGTAVGMIEQCAFVEWRHEFLAEPAATASSVATRK